MLFMADSPAYPQSRYYQDAAIRSALQAAARVVIEKAEADRKLMLYRKNLILRTYKIALGEDPVGKKQCEALLIAKS